MRNKLIYILALLIPIILILTLKSEKVEDISTDRESSEAFQNIDTIIDLIEEKNLFIEEILNKPPKVVEKVVEKVVFLEPHYEIKKYDDTNEEIIDVKSYTYPSALRDRSSNLKIDSLLKENQRLKDENNSLNELISSLRKENEILRTN